jgi:hypothetical protein
MLTSESIEERVWETLKLKKSLFAGVFDTPTGEVSFAKLGRKTMMQAVKDIFADQPGELKPASDAASGALVAPAQEPAPAQETVLARPYAEAREAIGGSATPVSPCQPNGVAMAAASFLEAGLRFIETIAEDRAAGNSMDAPNRRLSESFSGLISQDARTNRPVLSIPLPESITQERLTGAITALLNASR